MQTAAAPRSGAEFYRAACATCHGADGRGNPKSHVGFDIALPDFTDCSFATPEAEADWFAVVHQGGPVRAFARQMPAFNAALSEEEIVAAVRHVRGFCSDARWPRGDLNMPRALMTEKAFPENEALLTTTVSRRGGAAISNTAGRLGASRSKCPSRNGSTAATGPSRAARRATCRRSSRRRRSHQCSDRRARERGALERFRDELGVEATPAELARAKAGTLRHLQESTARLRIERASYQAGRVVADVAVDNLSGHNYSPDPAGAVSTGLLKAVRYAKDNRLLPEGFDKRTAQPDIAVHGEAREDADFVGGSDRVRYVVDVPQTIGNLSIEATLLFQPIGFRWAENLRGYKAAEPLRFLGYFEARSAHSAAWLAKAAATVTR